MCKHCQKEGHWATDDVCEARAPRDIQDSVEVFRGGKFPLSNLHKCPEGCRLVDVDGKEFLLSEHHYQRAKFIAHDKTDDMEKLMVKESPFKVMQLVQQVLPDSNLSEDWKDKESKIAMSYANAVKFHSCPHAMEALLNSKPLIAEATGDRE